MLDEILAQGIAADANSLRQTHFPYVHALCEVCAVLGLNVL